MKFDLSTVAIVVPLSLRPTLTVDEETSLNHLVHYLGRYDKYLVVPETMQVERAGFKVAPFSTEFFGSPEANSRLNLTKAFYMRFRRYKYILYYHLDSLVLSDQLLEWCETDLDYIGPPWLKCDDSPWVTKPRVGNTGFALIKVESFLRVFRSRRLGEPPDEYWRDYCAGKPWYQRWVNLPRKFLAHHYAFNGVRRAMRLWLERTDGMAASDFFWSDEAIKYVPEFRVASFETGLRFAFEVAPRLCFQLNNYQMPFGCHAWPRYDRAFWEPYLLSSNGQGNKP